MILARIRSGHQIGFLCVVGVAALACSASGSGSKTGGDGATSSGATGNSGPDLGGSMPGLGATGGSLNVGNPTPTPNCTADCTDFPEEPIFDDKSDPPVTADDIADFADPEDFAPEAYCVREPQLSDGDIPGAMLPANWLRPRFRWTAPGDETLFEIRLQHELEVNDLVIYTRNTEYLLPTEIWTQVGLNLHTPITVTIRGLGSGGVTGVSGTFQVAPVNAGGSMIFWATSSKEVTKAASRLLGFTVGDEGVASTFTLGEVQAGEILDENGQDLRLHSNKPDFSAGEVQCIGCHTSTPDGEAVVFSDDWPWDKIVASVAPGDEGKVPAYVTEGAQALLNMPWQGVGTMAKEYWTSSEKLVVTSYADRSAAFPGGRQEGEGLIWMDLMTDADITNDVGSPDKYQAKEMRNAAIAAAEGTAWGKFALTGETGAVVMPDLSTDGSLIAYTATTAPQNGHLNKSRTDVVADVHIVPFGNREGGDVVALEGASDPAVWEYYPSFSSDDAYIAFNRVVEKDKPPYYNLKGEIFVVPSEGGDPHRLAANDPPACTGETSPGVTNSWAKWSPRVEEIDGVKYYFLIFSSTRAYDGQFGLTDPYDGGGTVQSSQLYMAAFTQDSDGNITSYPAVYLWNQSNLVVSGKITTSNTTNLTPAWDDFVIPEVTVVVK
jgi:hypothetical protein